MKGAVYLCTDCFGRDPLIKAKMKVYVIISIIIIIISIISSIIIFSLTLMPSMTIQVDHRSFTGNNHLQVTNRLVLMIRLLMSMVVTAQQRAKFKFGLVQMGEGFGSSVAACDLNGDGVDDLIVGSPMYRCRPMSTIWPFCIIYTSVSFIAWRFNLRHQNNLKNSQSKRIMQRYFNFVLNLPLLPSDPSDNKKHNIGRVHTFLSTSDENQWGTVDGNTAMLDTPAGLESGARFGSAVSTGHLCTLALTL